MTPTRGTATVRHRSARSRVDVVAKHPGGRKSYWHLKIKDRLTEIEAWARDGYLEKHIAKMLGVSLTTFYKFKSEKSELANALKVNKEIADIEIENALRSRALGFEYKEKTTITEALPDGTIVRYKEKEITKRVLPDTTAQIFWLKNRQPAKWRDAWKIQLTGNNDGPVELANLSLEEYKKIRQEMIDDDDC